MRHAVFGRKLNRDSEHRVALRRNLAQSLIEHGQIRTTLPKAKELRLFVEKLVTLAIDGGLAARQRAIALLADRAIIPKANQKDYDRMSDAKRSQVLRSRSGRRYRASVTRPGVAFTAESVVHRLFADIGPRMKRRNEKRGVGGGYTRIIKLAERRIGDASPLALLQFVGEEDKPREKSAERTERKRRAKVKYAFYAGKPIQRRGPQQRGKSRAARPAASMPPQAQAAEKPQSAPPPEAETGKSE